MFGSRRDCNDYLYLVYQYKTITIYETHVNLVWSALLASINSYTNYFNGYFKLCYGVLYTQVRMMEQGKSGAGNTCICYVINRIQIRAELLTINVSKYQ